MHCHALGTAKEAAIWLIVRILSSLDAQVSNLIGPGVLAASVLSIRHVTYLDVATGLFGYYISHTLEEITGVRPPPTPHIIHHVWPVISCDLIRLLDPLPGGLVSDVEPATVMYGHLSVHKGSPWTGLLSDVASSEVHVWSPVLVF